MWWDNTQPAQPWEDVRNIGLEATLCQRIASMLWSWRWHDPGPTLYTTGLVWCFPANTIHWPNAVLMLAQRRRRWAYIDPTLDLRLVFPGFSIRWPDVGSALAYHWQRWRKINPPWDDRVVSAGYLAFSLSGNVINFVVSGIVLKYSWHWYTH